MIKFTQTIINDAIEENGKVLSKHRATVIVFTFGDKKFVLRKLPKHSAAQSKEIKNAQQASVHNLGPTIHYVDSNSYVESFVDGKRLNQPGMVNTKTLTQLANQLKKLHSLPVKTSEFTALEKNSFSSIEAMHQALKGLGGKHVQNCFTSIKNWNKRYFNSTKNFVPCHFDLEPSNIIQDKTGNLVFIDWEKSTLGDPILDLGKIITTFRLTATQAANLTGVYFQRAPTPIEDAKIQLASFYHTTLAALQALTRLDLSSEIAKAYDPEKPAPYSDQTSLFKAITSGTPLTDPKVLVSVATLCINAIKENSKQIKKLENFLDSAQAQLSKSPSTAVAATQTEQMLVEKEDTTPQITQ